MKKLRTLFTFNKESSGSWYVDLPEYPGPKGDLLMVSGADTLLDILAGEKNSITIAAQLEPFQGSTELRLTRIGISEGGGYYYLDTLKNEKLNLDLWLCDAVKFVFGFVPEKIYIDPKSA